jgi:DNA-binding MarR family transcriptional regulator
MKSQDPLIRVPDNFTSEFPAADPLASECAMNLMRVADLILRELSRFFQRYGLTPASAHVVGILEGADEPLSPHQIAEQLYIATSTMTSLIDTVERRGLARRVPHPTDRRKILIEITDEGRRGVHEATPLVHEIERHIFSPLTAEQKEQLLSLLAPLMDHIGAGAWDVDNVPPRNKVMRYESGSDPSATVSADRRAGEEGES